MQVLARFEARLEETQRTQVRYGFRNEQWLRKHHGDKKAEKIMKRKKDLSLTLAFCIMYHLFCLFQPVTQIDPKADLIKSL